MGLKKTYKHYSKIRYFFYSMPKDRILKFKRPKWKKIKKELKKIFFWKKRRRFLSLNLNKALYDNSLTITLLTNIYLPLTRNYKLKFAKKSSIHFKRAVCSFFNHSLTVYDFKKLLAKKISLRKNLAVELLIRPFFKLEILLWKLGIFKTISHVKQFLHLKKIFINNKAGTFNRELKEGDFVHVLDCQFKFSSFTPTFLWSILDIDYYCSTIVILKDYNRLDVKTLYLLNHESIDLEFFIDYVRKY